jgi:hypothetical protein
MRKSENFDFGWKRQSVKGIGRPYEDEIVEQSGSFFDKARHSCEGRNPENALQSGLDARPRLHGGRLFAGVKRKTSRPIK